VYPAIYEAWKWHFEVSRTAAPTDRPPDEPATAST